MAIVCTEKGKTTNDGLTAVVNSIATTNGLLYLVVGAGNFKGSGAIFYDSLVATSTGPTPTLGVYKRSGSNSMTPLASIYWFLGDGSTVNVTVTMGTPTGSPTVPLTGCQVVEVTGGTTLDRSNSSSTDSGAGPWDFDLVIAGSPVALNQTFGVNVTAAFTSLMTITPRYTETQVGTGNDVHATGNGYGGSAGSNMTWQSELSVANTLTVGWHGDVDDYQQAHVAIEIVGVAPIIDRILMEDGFSILQEDGMGGILGENGTPWRLAPNLSVRQAVQRGAVR